MHLSEQNLRLWEQVSAFDLAEYAFNYGFALRLATENGWSFQFTDAAIEEYKKFMFLAAISEEMIAPSEIVDTVWHLHLIYSDAYRSFCILLGKEIRHVPSRKQEEEQVRFKAAQQLTEDVYEPIFGPMPEHIWQHESMYDSLHLSRSAYTPEKVKLLVLALIPGLTAILYFLLRPFYRGIDSAYFLPGYFALGIIIFFILRKHNQQQFKQLIDRIGPDSFLFQLGSMELITLKSGTVKECIHALSNELILNDNIAVDRLGRLSVVRAPNPDKTAQLKLFEVFDQFESPFLYEKVLSKAMHTPYFQSIQVFADQLRHYINTSKEYMSIIISNYSCWGLFLTLGVVRAFTGLSANKPVVYILFLVLIFTLLARRRLKELKFQFSNKFLPAHYLHTIGVPGSESALQWGYFQSGRLALTAVFIPVVGASIAASSSNTASGSSCGTSSCGASCGSGCGGCGGD